MVEQISHIVYQAILAAQQYPHYFTHEKYCCTKPKQAVLTQELATLLTNSSDNNSFLLQLKQFLQKIFVGFFFESAIFSEMAEKLLFVLAQSGFEKLNLDQSINEEDKFLPVSKSSAKDAIAILLLDAENLKLDTKAELFLASTCQYPIQVKIAFANWKAMGKRDVEFHGRGYQMIHVPAGKNSADMEMTAFGSAILAQYPAAKEVLVCASDSDLNHLKNRLQSYGLLVYSVRQQEDSIVVINHRSGDSKTFNPNTAEIPTASQFIQLVKQLIRAEQARTKNTWIKLSVISKLFHQAHQLTLSQVISSYRLPGNKVKDFFLSYPTEFAVHQLSEQSEIYIMPFSVEDPITSPSSSELTVSPTEKSTATPSDIAKSAHAKSASLSSSQTEQIKSEADLEASLISVLRHLIQDSKQDYHSVSAVGVAFREQYGRSVTLTLKALKISANVTQFLKKHSVFELRQNQAIWEVALAKVPSSSASS